MFLLILLITSANVLSFPTNFNLKLNLKTSKVLQGPGFGWDYLTEDVKYPTQIISYRENKKTSDGIYLIPDCMAAENVKKTKFTDLADVIKSKSTFVSKTSKSVKAGFSASVGVVSFAGSYSKDFMETIEEQSNTSTITTRTKYIDHRYTLLTNSRCPLDEKFKYAVEDLLYAIEFNDDDSAEFLAQSMINDFGSHYVTKINIGGTIYTDDYVSDAYWEKMKTSETTVQQSASISLGNMLNASYGQANIVSTSEYKEYQNSVKKSMTQSIGGRYIIGMSAATWATTLEDNYVPIDREAGLLSFLILPSNFPSFPPGSVYKAKSFLDKGIAKYLNINTIDGCLDKNNINYNPQAFYDSGNSCQDKLKFGGFFSVYKKCSNFDNLGQCTNLISSITEHNIITKQASCPSGYVGVSGISNNPLITLTQCVGDSSIKNGNVLFGGIYSSINQNPVTGSQSCPIGFVRSNLFDSNDNFICQSTDLSVENIRKAVPFGGFVGNCFTGLPSECPTGLELKPINIINGCQISYCTRIKNFSFPELKRPPFVPKPPSFRSYRLYRNQTLLN